jgi:hypothetical protein
MIALAQDGRIYIERVNAPFLGAGGSGEQFRASLECAIALGWLRRRSGRIGKALESQFPALVTM